MYLEPCQDCICCWKGAATCHCDFWLIWCLCREWWHFCFDPRCLRAIWLQCGCLWLQGCEERGCPNQRDSMEASGWLQLGRSGRQVVSFVWVPPPLCYAKGACWDWGRRSQGGKPVSPTCTFARINTLPQFDAIIVAKLLSKDFRLAWILVSISVWCSRNW